MPPENDKSVRKGREAERFCDAVEGLYGWNVNKALEQ